MAGRTVLKHTRVYIGGIDVSGYTRSFGPLAWEFSEVDLTTITDAVKGALPGDCTVGLSNVNAVLAPATASTLDGSLLYGVASNTPRIVTIAVGDRAAPVMGVPTFNGRWNQNGFNLVDDAGAMTVNIPFGAWDVANLPAYKKPWGNLIHASATETAVNAAIGWDSTSATTNFGGFMVYHVSAGAGTGQIKVQHSTTTNLDGSFSDLGGCDSGVISFATPTAGIVPTTLTTTAVGQFLRWQVVYTAGGPSVTFVLSFIRALSAWGV
jgi:hypothetical protein